MLPDPINNLIQALERLPGIGPKTASRLAFFLLKAPPEVPGSLSDALADFKNKITFCNECFNITSAGRERCEICESSNRDAGIICVVEEPLDLVAIERISAYKGRYHVLQGVLSPIEGIGPDDLKIKALLERVQRGGVQEVILATNPTMEGEATAQYLQPRLQALGIKVTRLARGLPVGGDLEYADQNTLLRALTGRQEMGD
jgi:recombination protein RecR